MALTATERTNIVKLTVALYNAAPGASGLSDFTTFYEANGRDLNVLATNLTNNIIFKSLYPNFLTVGDFATAILSNYGLQANTDAIAFITSRFNAGMNKGQIAYEAAIAINNTSAATGDFANARAILNNKTLVAENYSVALSGQSVNIGVLQGVITGVTADPATVTAANNTNANAAGQTFTLTTGVDTLTGTGGNDTFTADNTNTAKQLTAADSINGGAGNDTLRVFSASATNALDNFGTLTSIENLFINGANYGGLNLNVSAIAGLTSLQYDTAAQTYATTVTATNVSQNANATTTITVGTGQAVTLSNLTPSIAAQSAASTYANAIANGSAVAGAGSSNFVTTVASAAAVTSQALTVNKVTTGTHTYTDTGTSIVTPITDTNTVNLSGVGVVNLNLTSTGVASTFTLTDTGGALANIVIGTSATGDAALTMTIGSGANFAATGIASINAAADTAATTITTVVGTNLSGTFAYTGGTANDSLDLTNAQIGGINETAAQLNAQTFNGGAGINTLILNNSIAAGAVALTSLTNIQIIGDSAAAGVVNMANFGAATGFAFTGALAAGGVTINNLASSATLAYGNSTIAGNAVVVNAAGNGLTDTLAVTFGSATAVVGAATAGGTTNINGYETVNLTAQGAIGGTDTLLALAIGASAGGAETLNVTATRGFTTAALTLSGSSTTVNVTGAGAFTTAALSSGTFNSTGTGAITIGTGSNILAFNAGTVNANTSILDTAAGSGASITTGNGINTITGGGFNDVIKTGTGANTITGGAGADNITVGIHNGTTVVDKFTQAALGDSGTFAVPGANTISTSTFDVINGALKGDQITLTTFNNAALGAGNGQLATGNAIAANTLAGLAVADNQDLFVRGTYTAGTNTFVGSATGTDSLFVYDGNQTAGTTAYEAIVLVGYVAASVTGVNAAAVAGAIVTLG